METIIITGNDLTLDALVAVSRHGAKAALSEEARANVLRSRAVVERLLAENRVVYGVTTGVGKFADVIITAEESRTLQKNLIISHAVGAGKPFPAEVVRGMMLLRANSLAKGFSGVRPIVIDTLLAMLNAGVVPVVPEKGSLGASGDLVPLAHAVLPMLGEGRAVFQGAEYAGAVAMQKAGIPLVELSAKEGLALINGTQAMTAVGALTVSDAIDLVQTADLAVAMSFEAHRGVTDALDARLHKIRAHTGQIASAAQIARLLSGSGNVTRQGELRVQDAYSLRCAPQVHGASRDAIAFVAQKVEIEMNAVTDNPILFSEPDAGISGGNFHGQPVALAFDFLGIALAELADISERRIERMVNAALSGLPAFLTRDGGVNSGFMIVQYTAAALVSENKVLAHPASVDSIPSSANQEDHVSMGTIAARKAREILINARRVLAMELMCACQAIDLGEERASLGAGTAEAYRVIREKVEELKTDRPLYEDINRCESVLEDRSLLCRVAKAVGAFAPLTGENA